MKKNTSLFLAALAIFVVFADVFTELDITKDKAKQFLVSSIGTNYMTVDRDVLSKARNMPVEMQVEAVRELIQFAKEYSQSDAFKNDYKKWRNEKINGKKKKFGIPNPTEMLDKALDKTLNKEENEKRYPSDPSVLIKQRLTEFLEVSATVDFDAGLKNGMFVNPDYEKKSPQWKMCYRAGKEVVDAARSEAKTWLDELK
jgi:hypothetical protein